MTKPDAALEPWQVRDIEPSAGATLEERALAYLRFAVLAPSSHNTQPWRFDVLDDNVAFVADRSRRLEVVDPHDRALVMSVSTALESFCIAAHHFGDGTVVHGFPDPTSPELVATVSLETTAPYDHDLFAAIPHRRTTRAPFDERDLPETLLAGMTSDASALGVRLVLVPREQRSGVAELIAAGDAIQMGDRSFRSELASWVRSNTSERPDGIRGYGFGFSNLMSHASSFVIRTFDLGRSQGAKDLRLAEQAGSLAVLATDKDTPHKWLATGRALTRMLLRLAANGATASFLNQPIEVPELRQRIAAELGITEVPQLLLRCGYGPEVRAEPRRPVESVLTASERSTR